MDVCTPPPQTPVPIFIGSDIFIDGSRVRGSEWPSIVAGRSGKV